MPDTTAARRNAWAHREALDAVVKALCQSQTRDWRERTRNLILNANDGRQAHLAEAFRRAVNELIPEDPARGPRTTRWP